MSERSNFSAGPRANPLHGGRSTGSSTRNKGFADSEAGSPQGSPRSGRNNFTPATYYPPPYENPGYMVETPGRHNPYGTGVAPDATPYRPPSYFVQTPAHSDHNVLLDSPVSSAPSSPRPYAEHNYDNRSVKSGRQGRPGVRHGDVVVDKMGEEYHEEDYYPDEYRDKMRRRRQLKVTVAICMMIVVGILVAAAITAWILYQPTPVSYTFNYATVNEFQLMEHQLDSGGLPTDQLYGNMTLVFAVKNPNNRYSTYFDGGLIKIGYSSIPDVLMGEIGKLKLNKTYTNFTGTVSTMAFPLYGAAYALRSDLAADFVTLSVNATLYSHVSMVYKLLEPAYTHSMGCIININPATLQYLNDTCVVHQISGA